MPWPVCIFALWIPETPLPRHGETKCLDHRKRRL